MDLASIKTTDGLDVAGKRVLVRADLNVPVEDGAVADATRIERVLPTIEALRKAGAKVVLMSHFGRPKGERSPETSLKPVAAKLTELLGTDVLFLDDCIGPEVEAGIASLKDGDVVLLENLRYHAGETKNDIGFAKQLAALGDIYVDDAFSCAHRAHASVEAIARLMPAYAGMAMMAEIDALSAALEYPKRPVMAVVGGAKVSTKIEVLTNLAQRMDMIVVGGGMANTFLFADGIDVGKSLCEPDFADTVKEITEKAKASGCEIVLPVDVVVANSLAEDVETSVCGVDEIPADALALDQGPKSVDLLIEKLEGAHTVLWNGPLGAFEIAPFGAATFALATEAGARTKAGKLISVAGGGDTVRALNMAGAADNFTYISTAGGAFLEWLAGEQLPGVAVLADGATPPQSAVA
ncbi:phosphoglycerate kinase [Methyloceanibacter stevinii]|uniref:Phosphoglycerate kinase n=1 Tax=Methyloceanibacter stevinii TaxID=1774970 RepID=A0A1E3VKX5_9HYPH|nr:phosphoglycerate kinase [Methyloceanibacter stevinii]